MGRMPISDDELEETILTVLEEGPAKLGQIVSRFGYSETGSLFIRCLYRRCACRLQRLKASGRVLCE